MLLLPGCGSEAFRSASTPVTEAPLDSLGAVVVLPCGSRVATQEDPDGVAAGMATNRWHTALVERGMPRARMVSRQTVEDLAQAAAVDAFYHTWLAHPEDGKGEALPRLALRFQAQTLLVAGVHVWSQDEERTRVGMLAGLFDGDTGAMLWWGEQVRERSRAPGDAAPPDFVVVMDSVAGALLESLPPSVVASRGAAP